MSEEANKIEKVNSKSEQLNETIKQWLIYVGFASAIISSIAYIFITIVMIRGFTTDLELTNQITFAVIGAVVGVSITVSLIMQGVTFAKKDDEAQRVMSKYYEAINKSKKEKDLKTIGHYLFWAIAKTIVIKGATVAVTSFFVLYIFIEGNGSWALLGLAFANILMFIGFGLVGLSNAYDFYLKQHLPAIKEITRKHEEKNKQSYPLVKSE